MVSATAPNRRTRQSQVQIQEEPTPRLGEPSSTREERDAPGETEDERPVSSAQATRPPTQSAGPATAAARPGNHSRPSANMPTQQESAFPGLFPQTGLGSQFPCPPTWDWQQPAPASGHLGEGWYGPNYSQPSPTAAHIDAASDTRASGQPDDDSPMSSIEAAGGYLALVCGEASTFPVHSG